ncbi:MAG: HIT family protein [Erysipelotrichaceae bacterium]|nr:HIT family protein [Erysipelotrichaceae bacterium]
MCIFCMIANHEIPSSVVYEDDTVIAILDLSQVTKGHTLVMPKEHYETLIDVPSQLAMHMMEVVQIVAKRLTTNLHAKGFNVLNNGGELAGQTVMHAHIHIIPRYEENDGFDVQFHTTEKPKDLAAVLSEING